MYLERPATIPGAIVWTRTPPTGAIEPVRVLPDGCMDLIWTSDGRPFVAGPDTQAHLYEGQAGVALAGIRFPPGIGPSVIGVGPESVRDRRFPLDEIWSGPEHRALVDRLSAAADPATALEAAASRRIRSNPPGDAPRIREIVRLLRAGRRVAEVAAAVNLSERQLRRRALDAFGYGPKTLARILRLAAALEAARTGAPFVDAAATAGFADQAHLARDVRALAGVPLSALVDPASDPSATGGPDVRFVQDRRTGGD